MHSSGKAQNSPLSPDLGPTVAGSRPSKPIIPAAPLFPVSLKLAGRSCLVVGAGSVGESKIEVLLATDASARVVAHKAAQHSADGAGSRRMPGKKRSS